MLREKGPTPLHRLSFAPVWTSSAPQEVLEFMLEEEEATSNRTTKRFAVIWRFQIN